MKQGERKKGFTVSGQGEFKIHLKNFVVRNTLAYLADETGKGKKRFYYFWLHLSKTYR